LSDAKVLTAKDGDFVISDDLRSMLAFTSDGKLYINKARMFDPHVRGFMAKLTHMKVEFTQVPCDLSVIEGFYSMSSKQTMDISDMQRYAIDLFERAVAARASDIHIRVSEKNRTQIRFRVHNDLEFIEEQPYEYGERLCAAIYHAMTDVSDSTFEVKSRQDARISSNEKLPKVLDGIRVATSPQVGGFIMVLRLLYNDTASDLDLKNLGFHDSQVLALEYMKKRPTGIIVIGGPTGSGKSTTLQRTMCRIIDETQGRKHIITVEDPPEYPIPGSVQTPVDANTDTAEDRSAAYQAAIKAAMRLDPDIIMVSEVRDTPTARLSVQAAMTGHQVWTTVHANNALAIIDRLQDLGVPLELLTDTTIVAGLVSQQLVKRLCDHCKVPITEVESRFATYDIKRMYRALSMDRVYVQGAGCPHCRHTGVIGRTVVAEVVITDLELMRQIREGDRIAARHHIRENQKSMTMLQHAIEKINAGLVDPFQAEEVVGALDAHDIEQDNRVTMAELRQ
jgi:general secretion pathway protein E